ncbi:MAG: hypothetical protein A3D44_04145 [Candidatus Staskawiczbacteria bacterium RIFCSPHIGHO2_02_FULL_42_22]|uniref:Uncharacterized protein n=1 Tax=Candidatus Staskawiczbacteria bacterium RIFCSPHIGHO2_02_FULL_42_22 TaxID=1802207 RepID=A0A1G2I1N8_9BACT|nr:MAG: hypothetical protein A3D44_04145 [Candidatus Staskawiczbacteria bacterium RIFCSPHIGHO2_02_FULL_42_22]
MQMHLISESVNLTPHFVGHHAHRERISGINKDLEKFGLQIFDLSFDSKSGEFHYCVSSWYNEGAYALIEKVVKTHTKS